MGMAGNGRASRAWKGDPGKGEKFPRHSLKGERVFMDVSRRGFLKLSGATLAASGLGISLSPAKANAKALKTLYTKESLTVCPYCSVGCGIIVSVRDGKVINTEGDPDHPINQGTLCPKGGSIYQMANNKNRLDKPRLPGALRDGVEGSRVGMGPGQDRPQHQDEPRQELQGPQREGRARQPHGRHRLRRLGRHGQRGVLALPEIPEGVGSGVHRTPGQDLTQRHCTGSGRVVRTRRDDESLD